VSEYHTIKINRAKLVELIKASEGKVKYRLGAKPHMDAVPGKPGFLVCDCSGYVRWLLYNLGVKDFPDGSWYQRAWCDSHNFKRTAYEHAVLKDDRLRIAFIDGGNGKVGHVWLVINGKTIESCGGRGTCRRPWDAKTLKTKVDHCYVLTNLLS
jgi:hypothetical protein